MAKRIIKPDSGNTLVLQEDNGSIDALTVETNGDVTLGGNLVIPDSGTIGSESDTDAITINSSGNVTFAEDATINGITVGLGAGSISTNTVVGNAALNSNTTGIQNSAHSYGALYSNTTGNYNTANGYAALNSNTTGANNVAHGRAALYANTTGTNNVAIGYAAGNDALATITTQSNHVVLGNNSTTTLYCKTNTINTSDIRDKNITGVVNHGLEFIKQLNPIRFFFKKSREEPENHGPERYGFSAQEILELEGDDPIIIDNSDPDSLKMGSSYLIPVLVNAIKEQQVQIDALIARLDAAGL